jgi:hypothetical protein
MNKNCHNCGNAYPNYLHYIDDPCDFFGDEEEFWEGKDVLKDGCRFWTNKSASSDENSMEMN